MFKKKTTEDKELSALKTRVSKLPTADLSSWCDQALFGIGRSLSDWERYSNDDSLNEAKMGAEALVAVLEEIISRRSNGI